MTWLHTVDVLLKASQHAPQKKSASSPVYDTSDDKKIKEQYCFLQTIHTIRKECKISLFFHSNKTG